jgi:hypothetical protein
MNPFRISKSSFFNEYSGIPDFFSSRTKTIDEKEEMGPSQIQIQGFQNLVSLKALNLVDNGHCSFFSKPVFMKKESQGFQNIALSER